MELSMPSILLVEDDPNDVALFRRAVQKTGLKTDIHVAEDGECAISMLQSHHQTGFKERFYLPRLVLLDLKMPRVSGLEVLEWIRNQPSIRRLPVVVFTSSCETMDVAKAYELGANSYLVKPVSFDQLQEIVVAIHHYWIGLNEPPDLD